MSVAGVRIDKWLWAARFYRTRSAAQQAVAGGKVRLNGERTKPAAQLRAGDRLVIHIGTTEWEIAVEQLSGKRGPASVARQLYSEDEASQHKRAAQSALRRFAADPGQERHGRPTKRERRQLERWHEPQ